MNNQLHTLIADILHLSVDTITDELAMSEVEAWDSLQHMNLIASLEESYSIEFTFEEIIAMQTVAEIKNTLKKKGADI